MIEWHVKRGWSTCGYHYYIKKDGTIQEGRSNERTPCSARGHNQYTIAICCGGLELSKFTQEQYRSLKELCTQINTTYEGKVTFHGHTEVSPKSCPVYDYRNILGLDGDGYMGEGRKIGDRMIEKACSKGPDVTWLQTKLGLTADSLFGPMTEAAVREWQEDQGLESDGVVGFRTWEVLFDIFGDPNN